LSSPANRFESYMIGRNIQWENVKEIYKLGLKHGMKLAAISAVNGVYTDEDIRRVRGLAFEARAAAPTRRDGAARSAGRRARPGRFATPARETHRA
jgi:hypothetical protein